MANRHYGNLADVFKHLALCEVLAALRPGEYWESHAGAAAYNETGDIPLERQHGIHHVANLLPQVDALRLSGYGKALAAIRTATPSRIPGSPLLARMLMGDGIRRLLLCDTDPDALQNVQQTLSAETSTKQRGLQSDKLECVQEDGISLLRGAGILLPEKWTTSTLAFIDPYEITAATDAGITPLELACELANRSVAVLLFYTFQNADTRFTRQRQIQAALEKACLSGKAVCFEGSLKAPPATPSPTQWGFGMMGLCLRPDAAEAVDQKLRALAAAYEKSTLAPEMPGAWQYSRTTR